VGVRVFGVICCLDGGFPVWGFFFFFFMKECNIFEIVAIHIQLRHVVNGGYEGNRDREKVETI